MTVRRVGRYEIVREIGRGGMSVVHLARHVELGREVALKELAAFHAASPGAAARFVRESRLAGALAHPNVVTVYDFFEEDGTPFIAMEHLPHGSLRPLVGRLTLAQTGGVLEAVLAGLRRAEAVGVVHRDLKPENLLITGEGSVKITDFGIAKARTRLGEEFATAPGTTVGTPAYMAPEQALGGDVGPWTDLYATGVIAHELLLGRVPFEQRADEEPLAVMLRHVNEPVPPPEGIDEQLAAWVMRLLAKDPRERFQTAQAALDELDATLARVAGTRWHREAQLAVDALPAVSSPETFDVSTRAPTADPLRAPPDRQSAPPRRRGSAGVWWTVAVLAVAAGAGAGLAAAGDAEAPRALTVRTGALELVLPGGWVRAETGIPRVRGGAGGRSPTGAVVGAALAPAASGPSLLPAGLRRRGGRGQRVRVGGRDSLRFGTRSGPLWAFPLSRGVLLMRCSRADGACLTALARARVAGAEFRPAGPSPAYGRRLRTALAPLATRATATTRASTVSGRAIAAERLASAAAEALSALGAAPGAWEAGAHRRLLAALRAVRDRSRSTAGAAAAGEPPAMRRAEARLEGALRDLVDAQRALTALGYRTR